MSQENSEEKIGDNIAGDNINTGVYDFPDIPREKEGDNPFGVDLSRRSNQWMGDNIADTDDFIALDESAIYPRDADKSSLEDLMDDEPGDDDESEEELNKTLSSDISQNIIRLPNAETRWVKSFNLTYGSKMPYKVVNVEGDDLHYQLRCIENEARESRDYKGDVPNYVVAHIGFIVSDRAWVEDGSHGRRFISVPIKFSGQDFTHVTKVYKFDDAKQGKRKVKQSEQKVNFPRSAALLADVLCHSPVQKHDKIKGYYETPSRSFSAYFHHSERGLWGGLNNPIIRADVLQEVAKVLPAGGKIYCLVWDLHSTNYLCKDCDPSSFIVQDELGKIIQKELKEKGYTFSDKRLISFTRVSAEVCGGRSQRFLKNHDENYGKDIRNFRTEGLTVVLQRDDRASRANRKVIGAHGFFVSSEKTPKKSMSVYVARHRDSESLEFKLTDHNSNFANRLKENEQQIQALIAKCDEEVGRRDFAAALQTIEEAYGINSDHLMVLNKYGDLLFHERRYVDALFFWQKGFHGCSAIGPQSQDTQIALYNLQLARKWICKEIESFVTFVTDENLQNALDFVCEALDIDEGYGPFHFFEASILYLMNKNDEALAVIDRTLLDSRLVDVHAKTLELKEEISQKTASPIANSNFTALTRTGAGK